MTESTEFTRRVAELLVKVPLPPKAITWEHGTNLLDELQAIARDMAASLESSVSRGPSPDLRAAILNLPDGIQPNAPDDEFMRGFRFGHRAARKEAAELVSSHGLKEQQ